MASRGRDVPDGAAVAVNSDKKIVGANSKHPGVNSAAKSMGNLSLSSTEHVCNHGRKNKAEVEPQPRPQETSQRPQQPVPERPRPARKERLEDVFQDEIVIRFTKMSDFKKFARSRKGLRLTDYEISNVIEDVRSSEEQRLQMLSLWRQKLGRNATPQKIRELVDHFFAEQDEEEEED